MFNRREFLGATSGLLLPLSGCITNAGSRSTVTSEPSPAACREMLKPLGKDYLVREGALAGFSISLVDDSIRLGDQLTARLRNTSETVRTTGNRWQFDIQRRTNGAWNSIYSIPETGYWTDIAIEHSPEGGYTWELTFTSDGLSPDESQPTYYVCEPVTAGTYRFVYWGITSEEESIDPSTEYALAREFSVANGN